MTNSPTSSSDPGSGGQRSGAFERLHEKIRRWIWEKKWTDLQDIQEAAVDPILAADVDLIISAGTARGKTEAAFLPICSSLVGRDVKGVDVLYIGPLKALINDQFERLEGLCRHLEIPVHRWHGDVDAQRKKQLLEDPSGILLITPESLEALFVVHGPRIGRTFPALRYVVIDELHSFIGIERGRQLQSLLHRVETAIRHRVPRIGLSATLGDMKLAADFLRPGAADRVRLIRSDSEGQAIQLQLRGYRARPPRIEERAQPQHGQDGEREEAAAEDEIAIADHIFRTLRGTDNLIFTNRRRDVELYADRLRQQSERERVPNEFWPHHGSLAKDVREEVEAMLKDRSRPLNVVCTSTLEMGIDIGSVKSIAQIGCPPSVASLRQRLGRSGRRGDASIMRLYVREPEVTARTPPQDTLRAHLVQVIAMIQLLLARWCEPPDAGALHLSTLVQQVLSLVAQHGGVSPVDAWRLLCERGPFSGIDQRTFGQFLRDLGGGDLITQAPDGLLVLGLRGERAVNHFSFYTAFTTPEEYRLVTGGKTLGTLPVNQPLAPELLLIFAGRRWRIVEIDEEARIVHLLPAAGGRAPVFTGMGCVVHERVRREMRALYLSTALPVFLDVTARSLLAEGRDSFQRFGLAEAPLVANGEETLVFPWAGDRATDTLLFQLRARGLAVSRDSIAIAVSKTDPTALARHLRELLEEGPPDALALARTVSTKRSQKWDAGLGEELLSLDFASRSLDPVGAWDSLRRIVATLPAPTRPIALPGTQPSTRCPPVHVCWTMEAVLDRIEKLPVVSPLPLRTVVTPRAAVSHALRCGLVERDSIGSLIGTHFVSLVTMARAIVHASGARPAEGEELLRKNRIRRLFAGGLGLDHFGTDLLTKTHGWDEAFAKTISDLEWAGYRAADLSELDDAPAARDLRTIWESLDAEAGTSWTAARMVVEAASLLEAEPTRWEAEHPVLVLLDPTASAGAARLARSIPGVQVALLAARPLRPSFLARIEHILGIDTVDELARSSPVRRTRTDRDILASFLFEPAEVLSESTRARAGEASDGTVSLEDHAGVNSELDAATAWVARQVLEHGTPAGQIAVLLPKPDPLAELVRGRIAELRSADGPIPVHVAGGVPLRSLTAGARFIGVLRSLGEHLSADALADVMPTLRTEARDRPIPKGAAVALANSLGTTGGSPSNPQGALEWAKRANDLERRLETQLRDFASVADDEARFDPVRRNRDLERRLRQLRAIRPALEGLTRVAQMALAGEDLAAIWCAVREFTEQWLVVPAGALSVTESTDTALAPARADATCSSLRGHEALEFIEEVVGSLRVPVGQFGESAVYVGTVTSAMGLRFAAVRVIGLAEGSVPSLPREDPVLPDSLRIRMCRSHVDTTGDVSLQSLHALDLVVRHADRVVLSAPRMGLDRSYREPSTVFLEAAAAMGRPLPGLQPGSVPGLDALTRREFETARMVARSYRLAHPLREADWQDRLAAGLGPGPPNWTGPLDVDLARLEALVAARAPGPLDGLLRGNGGTMMPGLTPERPISAKGIRMLLECPHRFLFEQVLDWYEPAGPRRRHELDSLAYGTLFHAVVERFLTMHGAAFSRREGDLPTFQERALEIARQEFATMLDEYPLSGDAVQGQQLDRLSRHLRDFLDHEWSTRPTSQFVASERAFGFDRPVAIPCADGSLYVRGVIDLLETANGRTLVRDLKTGACKPRRDKLADPTATVDTQIAVYGAVTRLLAREWSVHDRIAAGYVYVDDRLGRDRTFNEDYEKLEQSAQQWFDLASALLRAGHFPRTPDRDDCTYCPFVPVCGPTAHERAASVIAGTTGPLADFAALKS